MGVWPGVVVCALPSFGMPVAREIELGCGWFWSSWRGARVSPPHFGERHAGFFHFFRAGLPMEAGPGAAQPALQVEGTRGAVFNFSFRPRLGRTGHRIRAERGAVAQREK